MGYIRLRVDWPKVLQSSRSQEALRSLDIYAKSGRGLLLGHRCLCEAEGGMPHSFHDAMDYKMQQLKLLPASTTHVTGSFVQLLSDHFHP